jgi:outer membrane biosynthesis protein TonB
MSAKGPAKGTATIQRLLDERRKYESWIARLRGAADAAAAPVRERVEADYTARMRAVDEELKVHAEAARQLIAERQEAVTDLRAREQGAAERLAEGELRHTVGEYDDEQWAQFRKDALAELLAVREELQELEADLKQLEEVNTLVSAPAAPPPPPPPPPPPAPSPAAEKPTPKVGPPPRPPKAEGPREKKVTVDELAFIKSVTDDDRVPSPRRASGAQFQPSEPIAPTPPARGNSGGDEPLMDQKADSGAPRTLKCPECGTMNMPTEWYCEQCGAELAAL